MSGVKGRKITERLKKINELQLYFQFIVKLRQGSGKERQGKARKGKDGER